MPPKSGNSGRRPGPPEARKIFRIRTSGGEGQKRRLRNFRKTTFSKMRLMRIGKIRSGSKAIGKRNIAHLMGVISSQFSIHLKSHMTPTWKLMSG